MKKMLALMLIGLVVGGGFIGFFFATESAQAQATGLVAYWNFEEGTGTLANDVSGNGHHGTVYGATWADGISGYGLQFDGSNDYVDVSNSADFRFGTQDFSCLFWFKVQTVPYDAHQIICKRLDGGGTLDAYVNYNRRVYADFGEAGRWTTLNSSTEISLDTWYYVAIVRNAGTGYLYMNGYLEDTEAGATEDVDSSQNLFMGRDPYKSTEYMNGTLDELMFYSRALTGAEVESHMITVPDAPQNLHAVPGNGVVELTWSAPASDGGSPITDYNVYRGTTSAAQTLLASVGNALNYSDTGVVNNQTYYYKVSAVNIWGESVRTNPVNTTPGTGMTVPSAPRNPQATAGDGRVTLSWTAPATNGNTSITHYNIYRGNTSGGESLLTTVGNVLSYNDNNVTNGMTYFYRLKAENIIGEGPYSEEVNAMPAASGDDDGEGISPAVLALLAAVAIIVIVLLGFMLFRKPKQPKGLVEWKGSSEPQQGQYQPYQEQHQHPPQEQGQQSQYPPPQQPPP